jgi:gas vesicle protein
MKNNGRGLNCQNKNSKWGPFLFGALAGGAVGAAIALLYAPAEGTEFRKDVGEKFDEITDSINAILRNAKMSAEKMLNEGRGQAEDIIDSAYSGAKDFVDDVEDSISGLKVRKADPSDLSRNGSNGSMNTGSSGDGSIGSHGDEGGYPSGTQSGL